MQIDKDWKRFAEVSWPAEHISKLDGWRIRENGGLGGSRANSLEADGATKLLPNYPRYMIWQKDAHFGETLASLGYTEDDHAFVLTAPLGKALPTSALFFVPNMRIAEELSYELAFFYHSNAVSPARTEIMERAKCEKFFLSYQDPNINGVCYVAIEQNRAWLYALVVAENARRRGIGRAICQSAMAEAMRRGAEHMALMVRIDNNPAIALYKSLGFAHLTKYHFMIKN